METLDDKYLEYPKLKKATLDEIKIGNKLYYNRKNYGEKVIVVGFDSNSFGDLCPVVKNKERDITYTLNHLWLYVYDEKVIHEDQCFDNCSKFVVTEGPYKGFEVTLVILETDIPNKYCHAALILQNEHGDICGNLGYDEYIPCDPKKGIPLKNIYKYLNHRIVPME